MFDWSNPDSWKPAVELVKEWQTLSGFLILVMGTVAGWATGFFRWVASKFHRTKPAAPAAERPLRFVADDYRTTHGPIGADETTGTHVEGIFDVTNVSDRKFVLLKVRLSNHTAFRPGLVGVRVPEGGYETKRALRTHQMSTAMIDLVFMPAIHRAGEDLIADVIFTDNYGDEHRLPSVRFRYMSSA